MKELTPDQENRQSMIDEKTKISFTVSQLWQLLVILSALTGVFWNLKSDLSNLDATVRGIYNKDQINEMFDKIRREENAKYDAQMKEIWKIKGKLGMD